MTARCEPWARVASGSAILLIALCCCWRETTVPSQAPVVAAPVSTPHKRDGVSDPKRLARSLAVELRVHPEALRHYLSDRVVYEDMVQPNPQVLDRAQASRLLPSWGQMLTAPDRRWLVCARQFGDLYTCSQARSNSKVMLLLLLCRGDDWQLVGVFLGDPTKPATLRQRLSRFSKAGRGCP